MSVECLGTFPIPPHHIGNSIGNNVSVGLGQSTAEPFEKPSDEPAADLPSLGRFRREWLRRREVARMGMAFGSDAGRIHDFSFCRNSQIMVRFTRHPGPH